MGRYKKVESEIGDTLKNENGIIYVVRKKEKISKEHEEIRYRYMVVSKAGWCCWVYDIYQDDKEGEIFWSYSSEGRFLSESNRLEVIKNIMNN